MTKPADIILLDASLDLPELLGSNLPVETVEINERINEIPTIRVSVQPIEVNTRQLSRVAALELVADYYRDLLNHVQFGESPEGFNPEPDGQLRIRQLESSGGSFSETGSWTYTVVVTKAIMSVGKDGVTIDIELRHEAALAQYYNPSIYSRSSLYMKEKTGLKDADAGDKSIYEVDGTHYDRVGEFVTAFNNNPQYRQYPALDKQTSEILAQFVDLSVNSAVADRALEYVSGGEESDDLVGRFELNEGDQDFSPGVNEYLWNTLTNSANIVQALTTIVNTGFNGFLAYRLEEPAPRQYSDRRKYENSGRKFVIPMKDYNLAGGFSPRTPVAGVIITSNRASRYLLDFSVARDQADPKTKIVAAIFPEEAQMNGKLEEYAAPPWFAMVDSSKDARKLVTGAEAVELTIEAAGERVNKMLKDDTDEVTSSHAVLKLWAESLYREHVFRDATCRFRMPLNLFSNIVGERVEIESDVDDPRTEGKTFSGFVVAATHRFGTQGVSGIPATTSFSLSHIQIED